jgi:putative ABC transport system ATP-binding protein
MEIELKNILLRYEGKPPLFQNLDLKIRQGDFIIIQGPSGSGKSSLLRLLNRLQDPSSGEILIDGCAVKDHDVTRLRRRIGYMQQTPVMIQGSVADNLNLPFRFGSDKEGKVPSHAELQHWLQEFLLEDVRSGDDAGKLSVGQKQRLTLIRNLLIRPKALLCDEPTSALDPQSREIVDRWLERLNTEREMTVVLVTHLDIRPIQNQPRRFHLGRDGLQEAG